MTNKEYICPVPAGKGAELYNGQTFDVDTLAFLIRDEAGLEFEGFIAIPSTDRTSGLCDIAVARIGDEPPHIMLRTYICNVFPFDSASIIGFIKHALQRTSEDIKNGKTRQRTEQHGNVTAHIISVGDNEDDEDIKW